MTCSGGSYLGHNVSVVTYFKIGVISYTKNAVDSCIVLIHLKITNFVVWDAFKKKPYPIGTC